MSEPQNPAEYAAQVAKHLERHDYIAQTVEVANEPLLVHTIGLWSTVGTEITVIGMLPRLAAMMIARAVERLRSFDDDERGEVLDDHGCRLMLSEGHELLWCKVVPFHTDRHLALARIVFADELAGRPIPAHQLLFPDEHGLTPDEPGCKDDVRRRQMHGRCDQAWALQFTR